MNKAFRWTLVALLVLGGASLSGIAQAQADVDCEFCTNAQDGDNESSTDQTGTSASGDAVGGQVVGVVSSGDTSVDATNHSEDVDISTGDTTAENRTANFTGQNSSEEIAIAADVEVFDAVNAQDGDNSTDISQAADATSGDGVGGQVIGVVTSAGGSADVVAANTSEDVDIDTGDADALNDPSSFVGQNFASTTTIGGPVATDVTGDFVTNAQDGDNEFSSDQSAEASSGDGVGGQVLGVVSAGDASVDGTNHSEDVDVTTGGANAENAAAAFVGQQSGGEATIGVDAADVDVFSATNAQDGDNSKELSQDAVAATGDAVAGQVAGVVTSAGGSADLVLANTTEDSDAETGESEFFNTDEEFVGQNVGELFVGSPPVVNGIDV